MSSEYIDNTSQYQNVPSDRRKSVQLPSVGTGSMTLSSCMLVACACRLRCLDVENLNYTNSLSCCCWGCMNRKLIIKVLSSYQLLPLSYICSGEVIKSVLKQTVVANCSFCQSMSYRIPTTNWFFFLHRLHGFRVN